MRSVFVLVLVAQLLVAQAANAGLCRELAQRIVRTWTNAPYENLEQAVARLPADNAAWSRQAQARWQAARDPQEIAALEREFSAVGKAKIDASISTVAREENVAIIAFPEEPTAYRLLAMDWEAAAPKSIHVKGKTAAQGIAQGYVPVDQSLSKAAATPEGLLKYQHEVDECLKRGEALAVPLRRGHEVAVIRAGDMKWVSQAEAGDRVVEVLADSHGRPFVSDVDLLAIAYRTPAPDAVMQQHRVVANYGDITRKDHEVINQINRRFHHLDGHGPAEAQHQTRSLVQHGVASRYAASPKLAPGNFPMTVYRPDGRIDLVADEASLKALYKELRSEGFSAEPNPAWGWSKEEY